MIETHPFLFGSHRYDEYLELFEQEGQTVAGMARSPNRWDSAQQESFEGGVFALDGDQPRGRTLWHLLRAAEGTAGFFQSANGPPGETFDALWLNNRHTFSHGLALHNVRHSIFEDGIGTAWTLRRPDLARPVAAAFDILAIAPFAGSPYTCAFDRALNQIVYGNIDLCREDLLEALRLSESLDNDLAREWRDTRTVPLIALVSAYLDRNDQGFNTALERVLLGHRAFWGATDRRQRTPSGYVAWLALGLCSLAHDAGMKVTVESNYIPAWLYRKEWDEVPDEPMPAASS